MAFNGSGTFVRLYSWVNDAAANIKIRADRMDNEMNGMSVGLSTCITKDGQTTITANLPMAGYRHTGVGDATDRAHYAKFSQLQDGTTNWIEGGGTADAITAAYSIPLTALIDGQLCFVRATAANATTTPTFSPSALTARAIVKNGGSALVAGDIAGDGHELILRYDLANTRWELLNPKQPVAQSIPYTAASASGSASLDFAEDTDNGTNKATVTAPATLAADATITLPSSTGTLATLAGTETLDNKALTDSTTTIVDDGDATKKLAFQCSGITTGTTRTVTIPDASGTMAYSYAPVTNSLGADVNLNSAVSYFDGPSVAQGTSGTWFVNGTATVYVSNFGANAVQAKLWDGTTVIASTSFQGPATGSAGYISIPLSGYIASPAANIRISVKSSGTSDKIIFNQSGNSKDSTITAIRVA